MMINHWYLDLLDTNIYRYEYSSNLIYISSSVLDQSSYVPNSLHIKPFTDIIYIYQMSVVELGLKYWLYNVPLPLEGPLHY